jgi:hypothetical protein
MNNFILKKNFKKIEIFRLILDFEIYLKMNYNFFIEK